MVAMMMADEFHVELTGKIICRSRVGTFPPVLRSRSMPIRRVSALMSQPAFPTHQTAVPLL